MGQAGVDKRKVTNLDKERAANASSRPLAPRHWVREKVERPRNYHCPTPTPHAPTAHKVPFSSEPQGGTNPQTIGRLLKVHHSLGPDSEST